MSKYIKLTSVIFTIAIVACSTTNKSSVPSPADDNSSVVLARDLANYIDSIPRLSVSSSGVNNEAAASFENTTNVLLVLDGVQIGRSLFDVLGFLQNGNQKVSVEFLKISKATTRYGAAGRNGALLINRV